jgi:hypothetical protein
LPSLRSSPPDETLSFSKSWDTSSSTDGNIFLPHLVEG